MARLAVETRSPDPPQGPFETRLQELVSLLIVACAVLALADPGVLLGAAVAGAWLWLSRPSLAARLAFVLLPLVPLIGLHSLIEWGWPWRQWLAPVTSGSGAVGGFAQLPSIYVEALAGPLWLECALLAARLRSRTVGMQVRRDHGTETRRWRAISGRPQPGSLISKLAGAEQSSDHPPGKLRLGVDGETGGPFDLELPGDLATHALVLGSTGSGKTNTDIRFAAGALASGFRVVIVDAKAGGLGHAARALAERFGVPFHLVDPDNPNSLGYNPCSGGAAAVANKLVGAFIYSAAAEIYKSIAMEVIPVVVRGLQAVGRSVTLTALYDALSVRGMTKIAHQLPDDHALRPRLLELCGRGGERTGAGGIAGLQYRLGALLEGTFGPLFRAMKQLDWDRALAAPSVTYIALSALASSEDVELMARVIAQDLKQACARRIRAHADGAPLAPVLAIFDEFAALNEAEQLVDLLLQARQAEVSLVVSTQYLPETTSLRKACLGAGLLVVHRVEAEDAEAIAAQFGTRRGTEITHRIPYETGVVEEGSVRRVDKYNVHPNELRNFTLGQAAVKSVAKGRFTIVHVYPAGG